MYLHLQQRNSSNRPTFADIRLDRVRESRLSSCRLRYLFQIEDPGTKGMWGRGFWKCRWYELATNREASGLPGECFRFCRWSAEMYTRYKRSTMPWQHALAPWWPRVHHELKLLLVLLRWGCRMAPHKVQCRISSSQNLARQKRFKMPWILKSEFIQTGERRQSAKW